MFRQGSVLRGEKSQGDGDGAGNAGSFTRVLGRLPASWTANRTSSTRGMLAAGGTVGGGMFPCAVSNHNNIEPSYYTFDLSIGYDAGDDPVNIYLKHLGIQLVVQNLMDRHPAFEYRIGTGAGNPAAFDISKNDQVRTIGLILTKTW